jgi:hypothetical protein
VQLKGWKVEEKDFRTEISAGFLKSGGNKTNKDKMISLSKHLSGLLEPDISKLIVTEHLVGLGWEGVKG